MGNVQRDTKSCKYTPEKQQNEKRQWQKQHFYQESQNDGNQKQRENYSFQNIRWKSSDKPERHKERTTTKLQNNPETKWHEYKGAFTCVRRGELTSPASVRSHDLPQGWTKQHVFHHKANVFTSVCWHVWPITLYTHCTHTLTLLFAFVLWLNRRYSR